jgi:hypothetical protein
MPQVIAFSDKGAMKMPAFLIQPEKVRWSRKKEHWHLAFSIPLSRLESKPTFNVFRQSAKDGETLVDSWVPEPGVFSIGSGSGVMRSAAMGRLILSEISDKE